MGVSQVCVCFNGAVCQPPLPEEDYPQEDLPAAEEPEELLATGPHTLPKEYALGHVSRTIIPRASLDRSAPPGWNLTVDPSGTWIFTCEHSPEQVGRGFQVPTSLTDKHGSTVATSVS